MAQTMTMTMLRCAVLLSAAACLSAANIKPGYFSAGGQRGMCYKFFGVKQPGTGKDLSWAEARGACQRGGGQLATFADKAEHDAVVRRLHKSTVYGKWRFRYWLGYTDQPSAGNWLDTTGAVPTPYAASLWQPNWPQQSGWRCATLWSPDGRLNTRQCHMKRPYICMYQCGKKTAKPAPAYKKYYSPGGGNGNCFKAVYALRTQQQASDHCAKEGGHLAHFGDGAEMRQVRTLMRNEKRASKAFWLDGEDVDGEYTLAANNCRVSGYMATLIAAVKKRKGANCLTVHYKKQQPVLSSVLCNKQHNFVCMYRCGRQMAGQCAPRTTKAPITKAPVTKAPEVPKTTKKAYKPGYWPAPDGKRGVCYKAFGNGKETATGAAKACRADGAKLANFVDAAEFDYLMLLKSRKDGPYWLDGSDKQSEAHFAFGDGTDFTYANTKFSEGNPDNYAGSEHCLATDGAGARTLNDSNCANRFRYFCMYKCE